MNLVTKSCTKCGRELPATLKFFYAQKRGKFGLKSWCKDCHQEYTRAYRAANPGQRNVTDRAYRLANSERRAEYNRGWRITNAERITEYERVYRLAHPEQCIAQWRNREARKKGNEGSHTAVDIQAQYMRQKGKCFYCHKKIGKKYHTDHVTPLVKGGSNGPENLVVACPKCNQTKSDKHPMDFAGVML